MGAVAKPVSIPGIVNFAVYVAVAYWLGADAVNGYSHAGRYSLAMHGRSTEVTTGVFEFSLWYTRVLIGHFVLGLVLGLWARPWRKS